MLFSIKRNYVKNQSLGSMVLIDGGLLHKSQANLSEKSRQAFTYHIVDSKCKYPESNWFVYKNYIFLRNVFNLFLLKASKT